MTQKSKFEARMRKTNAIQGKNAEDTRLFVEAQMREDVERKRAEERSLQFMAARLGEMDQRVVSLERKNTQLESEVIYLREMLARVGVVPQAAVAQETKPRGGLSQLHLWRMEQIRTTGTFTDPTTQEGWEAIGMPEYWTPDEDEHAIKLMPREDYMRGQTIHWNCGIPPVLIAFNEFDLCYMNDETFILSANEIKTRWLTLHATCKALTGKTPGQLMELYAKDRGKSILVVKRGPKAKENN